MAKFNLDLSDELIEQFKKLESSNMLEEMVNTGADVVLKNVKKNMRNSFKEADKLEKCLKKTKIYKTSSDSGINAKVGFYGYIRNEQGEEVPAPLIVTSREYGTSERSYEKNNKIHKTGKIDKKPFFRKSFNKNEIETAMLKVQEKYLDEK